MTDEAKKKLTEMLTWLLFTVAVALAPLYVNWVLLHGNQDFAWYHPFRHGELFLVSGAFAADGISRILRKGSPFGNWNIVIAAVCVYVLFGSTIQFGIAAPKLLDDQHPMAMSAEQSIRSLYYFGCMVAAGLGSII